VLVKRVHSVLLHHRIHQLLSSGWFDKLNSVCFSLRPQPGEVIESLCGLWTAESFLVSRGLAAIHGGSIDSLSATE